MVGAEEVCDAAVTKAAGLRSQNSAVDGPIPKKGQFDVIFFDFALRENRRNILIWQDDGYP